MGDGTGYLTGPLRRPRGRIPYGRRAPQRQLRLSVRVPQGAGLRTRGHGRAPQTLTLRGPSPVPSPEVVDHLFVSRPNGALVVTHLSSSHSPPPHSSPTQEVGHHWSARARDRRGGLPPPRRRATEEVAYHLREPAPEQGRPPPGEGPGVPGFIHQFCPHPGGNPRARTQNAVDKVVD